MKLLTAADPAYYGSFVPHSMQGGRSFQSTTEALRATLGGGEKPVDRLGEFAAQTAPMMQNQGVYNAFLAAGLTLGLLRGEAADWAKSLAC